MFEELIVLVEVFDGVGMVGAWAIHELVEVDKQALLGQLARVISYGDQRMVGRSMPILFVLLVPMCGGALVLILALCLALVLASVKDRSGHLLTGGVVCSDVEQVKGGPGLQIAKLVNQRLTGCPGEERGDDIHVDDIREGVALF